MAPFPCIATNTSPPLGGGAKKVPPVIAMTPPVWEFQGIPTKRPFSSWEFQLEFHRFQRREFPPREFQGPTYNKGTKVYGV